MAERRETEDGGMTWQPIETAPKMRTILLFAVTEVNDVSGAAVNWKMHTGWFHLGFDTQASRDEGWSPWTWNGDQLRAYDTQPTHWMPLPEPPA